MRFIESIKYIDGQYLNLDLHQERINRTFVAHFSLHKPHLLKDHLPKLSLTGIYKVRFLYDAEKMDVEYTSYILKTVLSLEVVEANSLAYNFKFENRSEINSLNQRASSDDIIICKEGMVTDASYANLAFWDGIDWFTPETFLLNGVRRQQLLLDAKIKKAPIHKEDIGAFEKLSLINAMLDLGDLIVPTSAIKK